MPRRSCGLSPRPLIGGFCGCIVTPMKPNERSDPSVAVIPGPIRSCDQNDVADALVAAGYTSPTEIAVLMGWRWWRAHELLSRRGRGCVGVSRQLLLEVAERLDANGKARTAAQLREISERESTRCVVRAEAAEKLDEIADRLSNRMTIAAMKSVKDDLDSIISDLENG